MIIRNVRVVSLLCLLVLVTACGSVTQTPFSGTVSTAPLSPTATLTSTATPDPAKIKGNLTVWAWGVTATFLKAQTADLSQQYPNLVVKVEVMEKEDLYQRLEASFVAGGVNLPDVVLVESNRLAPLVERFPEVFEQLQVPAASYLSGFEPTRLEQITYKDKLRALPFSVSPVALYYRTDWFSNAGIDPAQLATWNALEEALKKVGAGRVVSAMFAANLEDDELLQALLSQLNTSYFVPTNLINIASPEMERAVARLERWITTRILLPVKSTEELLENIKGGQVAAFVGGSEWLSVLPSSVPQQDGKWQVIPLPAFGAGSNRSAQVAPLNLAMMRLSKNPEAAWAYLSLQALPVVQQPTYAERAYRSVNLIPALVSERRSEIAVQPLPYFDGTPARQVFTSQLASLKPASYNLSNDKARRVMIEGQQALLKGEPATTVLSEAVEKLKKLTNWEVAENKLAGTVAVTAGAKLGVTPAFTAASTPRP